MTGDNRENTLKANLEGIRSRMSAASLRAGRKSGETRLVGVTKMVDSTLAGLLFTLGVHDLGESRPQELWHKSAQIPGAHWHFIGHMQRNKVEQSLPHIHLFHSVDSLRLLETLESCARKLDRKVPFLLEFNISAEQSKQGFNPGDLDSLVEPLQKLQWLQPTGLMGMAAFEENPEKCRGSFRLLRELRDKLSQKLGLALPELSMGMSNDFEIAIEEGSTLVRIGSTLWEGVS